MFAKDAEIEKEFFSPVLMQANLASRSLPRGGAARLAEGGCGEGRTSARGGRGRGGRGKENALRITLEPTPLLGWAARPPWRAHLGATIGPRA